MDAGLLLYRGGVRSLGKKKLADGNEYELFYKARTPDEIVSFIGAANNIDKLEDQEKRLTELQRLQAKFLTSSMCTETGDALLTIEQARLVPWSMKKELCNEILAGSNDLGDAGKD